MSDTVYNGAHSIVFISGYAQYHSWNSWYLIPSTPPVVAEPSANFKYVDIPGMNGSLDLTDYLTGTLSLGDRSGSFTFYLDNDHGNWADRRREIASFLNGRSMSIYLTDDPYWRYHGRVMVKNYTPGQPNSQITMEYRFRPIPTYQSP